MKREPGRHGPSSARMSVKMSVGSSMRDRMEEESRKRFRAAFFIFFFIFFSSLRAALAPARSWSDFGSTLTAMRGTDEEGRHPHDEGREAAEGADPEGAAGVGPGDGSDSKAAS